RGLLRGGVMYECVAHGVPFVLAGSIRDDGPLPDVITDVVAAQDAMRAHVGDIGVALMLASTLHAIAVGNMLPAGVETYCGEIYGRGPVGGPRGLVFTANAGLVDGPRFVVSRFRRQERRGEAKYDAEWFAAAGFDVLEIRAEPDICFEGAGDALPFGRTLLA